MRARQELAFTLRTRALNDDHSLRYERVERYDPSLPDAARWRLLEVNGRPPTDAERAEIEVKRNRKPRKRSLDSPADYLDWDNARLLAEDDRIARYSVTLKRDSIRWVPIEKLGLVFSINKADATIDHVSAGIQEPVRIALGLAKILDVDLDVQFEPPSANTPPTKAEVTPESSARLKMSKLGDLVELVWSDFREVPPFRGTTSADE